MVNTKMISKVAGIGIAASLALAGTANTAQALDFDFSFGIGSPGGEITGRVGGLADNTSNQTADYVWLYTPVGETFRLSGDNNFSVAGEMITAATFDNAGFQDSSTPLVFRNETITLPAFLGGGTVPFVNGSYASSNGAVTYTAVPFGVSTDMSIAILAGLYGASRLRKKLALRK